MQKIGVAAEAGVVWIRGWEDWDYNGCLRGYVSFV